ncbi:hypothetical protein [Stackebrandtia soli]|uniref:hypothetical protein n=1 Tax=Stackebrandtia soli TaxID=1892856 RepID=UPI0039E97B43
MTTNTTTTTRPGMVPAAYWTIACRECGTPDPTEAEIRAEEDATADHVDGEWVTVDDRLLCPDCGDEALGDSDADVPHPTDADVRAALHEHQAWTPVCTGCALPHTTDDALGSRYPTLVDRVDEVAEFVEDAPGGWTATDGVLRCAVCTATSLGDEPSEAARDYAGAIRVLRDLDWGRAVPDDQWRTGPQWQLWCDAMSIAADAEIDL